MKIKNPLLVVVLTAAFVAAPMVAPPPAEANGGVKAALYVLTGAIVLNSIAHPRVVPTRVVEVEYDRGGSYYDESPYYGGSPEEEAAFLKGRQAALRRLHKERMRAAYERGRASVRHHRGYR